MKVYKNEHKAVLYGFADPEGAAERRKYRSSVVQDARKKHSKNECRNNKGRSYRDLY